MATSSTRPDRDLHNAIGEAVVAALRDYTGRGAESVRTIIDRDTVVVKMRDVLTRGEQVLVGHGHHDEVCRMRRTFQEAMGPEVRATIAELTGREVVAFMSTNHVNPDYSVEIFVLDSPLT